MHSEGVIVAKVREIRWGREGRVLVRCCMADSVRSMCDRESSRRAEVNGRTDVRASTQPRVTAPLSVRCRRSAVRRVWLERVWPRRWQELGDMEDLDRSRERRAGCPAAGKVGRCVSSIWRAGGRYNDWQSVPAGDIRAAVSEEWRV